MTTLDYDANEDAGSNYSAATVGVRGTRIRTVNLEIECPPSHRTWSEIAQRISAVSGDEGVPVRLIVVGAKGDFLTIESSFVYSDHRPIWPTILGAPRRLPAQSSTANVVVSIIPTGVRAEIGGFAGDATPVTNLLASACDFLVTNPNTVTASDLYFAADNVQYVEGNLICRFMLGQLALQPVRRQPVGLVVEQSADPRLMHNVRNAINAMHTVAGTTIMPVVITERVEARCTYSSSFGHASGDYGDLDELLCALDQVSAEGCAAVGLVSRLDLPDEIRHAYFAGETLPNPWGSAEAILTHLMTSYYPVTAAHSPLLGQVEHTMFGTLGDPRDGAELISSSYLCSMVRALSQSPRITKPGIVSALPNLSVGDVRAIVMPESVVGNIPFFVALECGIPIILVRGNKTIFDITPARLGLQNQGREIYVVDNYMEAAGLLLALREGIDPAAITRPIAPVQVTMMTGASRGR